MRLLLTFILSLFIGIYYPQCTHTFTGYDSYGDGWNGASATITVNGAVAGTCNLLSGTSESVQFQASDGDLIKLDWISGSWDSEISWDVTDGSGGTIAMGMYGTTTVGNGLCPLAIPCASYPYTQDFETGSTLMTGATGLGSIISLDATGANASLYGAHLQGNTSNYWYSPYATGIDAFASSPSHIATLTRDICASTSPTITLTFDKKQTYTYNVNYSWFRVTVDGTPVSDVNGVTYFNGSNGSWSTMTYDLSSYTGNAFTIGFETCNKYYTGYTSTGTGGDASYIDNISIKETAPPPPFVVEVYPYDEGFDTEPNSPTTCCPTTTLSSTGWSNDASGMDDCDWSARDVNTPSLNTGPTEDQSGSGKYLYMEASGCYSKTAYLISPKFDFTQQSEPFLQFYYHMYGSDVAMMNLEWSIDQVQWFPAWSKSGDQGNSWKLGLVDLPMLKGVEAYFRITGTTGVSFESDMAFDGFQGFGSGQPLPITLVSFGGEVIQEISPIVVLDWTVGSQVNNDYFEIQRSTDVEEWSTIERVIGAGSNNSEMSYSIKDDNPVKGISYYRLKQTDFDGNFEIFNPIAITISTEEKVLDRRINLMGQEVNKRYKGVVLEIYTDGTYQKKYYK